MVDVLWNFFLGSLLIIAILIAWLVIYSFVVTAVKQWRRDHADHD